MIDLGVDGYVIVQTKPDSFVLKQEYMGKRNGKETVCYRTLAHCRSLEDAYERFLSLSRGISGAECRETLSEYLERIKEENTRLSEVVSNSMAGNLYSYNQKEKVEELPIVLLIPVGRDNRISRFELTHKCVEAGLICKDISFATKDRRMRDLVKHARKAGHTIIKLSDGSGYYRLTNKYKASPIEQKDLDHYLAENDKRAFSILKSISPAKKLREDYKAGRIT